jgi:hypothetical protein
MATVVTQDPEGVTLEMYDAVNTRLGVDENPPEGLMVHIAGLVDGQLRVVDVWESMDAHDRFVEERLRPAIAEVARAAGVEPDDTPAITTAYEAHHVVIAAQAGAAAGRFR